MEDKLSPCIEVCLIDYELGICTGCHRTLDEISGWMNFSDEKKREVLSVLEQRKEKYESKK